MHSNKLLTIAIPAYNMEKYLKRCLDSVLLSEVEQDIEVLLINDGSKDLTLEIARQFETNHTALRVIDKPNGGWGSAINIAIKEAMGKYFKILDSDDWFESSSFVKFVNALKRADVDLVVSSYSKVYDDNETVCFEFEPEICGLTTFSEIVKKNKFRSPYPMATLCYRTELIKDIQLADRYYADVEYALVPTIKVKSVCTVNVNLYQYYLSRTDHSTSIEGYKNHFSDYIIMMEKIVSYYEENAEMMDDDMRIYCINEIAPHVMFSYYLLLSPTFKGGKIESKCPLYQLENTLKTISPYFYRIASRATKKGLPYIKIWRLTSINILNIRKWI